MIEDANQNQTLYYVCTDHLGSITALVDVNGNIAEEYSYDAWGRRRNITDWTFDNVPASQTITRGYTGQEHLDCFGLINMNGRAYDPLLGQFLSPDPFVQDPTNTQSYNRYAYCLNNPLKYTDPSGFLTWAEEQARNYAWGASYTQIDDEFYNTYQLQDKSLKYSKFMGGFGYWIDDTWCDIGKAKFSSNLSETKIFGDLSEQSWNVKSTWTPLEAGNLNDIIKGSGGNQNYSYTDLGVFFTATGIDAAKRKMYNNSSWFSIKKMKSYSIKKYNGNYYTGRKGGAKRVSTGFKIGGYSLGIINAGLINMQYNAGEIDESQMYAEQLSNFIITTQGINGMAWGFGWELGRAITNLDSYQKFKQDFWDYYDK